jgi:DNA-binding response OmpR family regulator
LKKKILLIDDQAPMLKILTEILKKGDFEIFTAINGKIGIERAIEIKPDLIIMDLMMPVMTGLEALVELKKMIEFKSTPIFILTAKGSSSDSKIVLEAGATKFIPKPFSPGIILDEIQKVLNIN